MRTLIVASLGSCALALAACGQGGADAGKSGEAASDSATPSAAATVMGSGPRPGLWRVTMQAEGMPAGIIPPMTVCTTERTFEAPGPDGGSDGAGTEGADCTNIEFRQTADGFEGGATCQMEGGVTVQTQTKVTGDIENRYVMENTVTMTPAPAGAPPRRSTMTFERIGDCPEGTPAGMVSAG